MQNSFYSPVPRLTKYVELFKIFWLSFICLLPYLLVLHVLSSIIDIKYLSIIWDNVAFYVAVPWLGLMGFLLLGGRVPTISAWREYLAKQPVKIFKIGFISFIIVTVLLIIFNLSDAWLMFLILIGGLVILSVDYLILSLWLKAYRKIDEVLQKLKEIAAQKNHE
ncbi:MAG: hypothetical protein ACOZAJ_00390 [Patescibacteria group bacterium]